MTGAEDEKEPRKLEKRGVWGSKGMRPGCVDQEVRRTEGMDGGGCEEKASVSQEAERNNLERKANAPENPRD